MGPKPASASSVFDPETMAGITDTPCARLIAALAALLALAVRAAAGAGVAGGGAGEDARQDRRARRSRRARRRRCEAVGSVTGFQMIADGTRAPFKAREDGYDRRLGDRPLGPEQVADRLLRRLLRVGRLRDDADRADLGAEAQGRAQVQAQGAEPGGRAQLGARARRQTFTLTDPLKIRKGEFLALTIPTWSPSFAVDLERAPTNVWRSSRDRRRVLGHREHQGRQAAAEGRLDARAATAATTRPAPRSCYWGYYVARIALARA